MRKLSVQQAQTESDDYQEEILKKYKPDMLLSHVFKAYNIYFITISIRLFAINQSINVKIRLALTS